MRSIDDDTDILLVTSAQNTTSINYNQWNGMLEYSKFIEKKYKKKVQIVVIPVRYRNPTSPTEDISVKNKKQQWWVDEVDEYLYHNKIEFGDSVIDCNLPIRVTTQNPLNGLDSIAGDHHYIVGSLRHHFKIMPRFRGEELRAMATTGSLTVKNYSRSLSGSKGFFNHSYGFTIIEKKKDGTCHVPRCVSVEDNGNFTDLIHRHKNGKLKIIKKVDAMVMGDIHREVLDEKLMKATIKLTNALRPKAVVVHDVLDGYRFNHHEKKDMFILRQKIVEGKYLIKEEINQAVEFPQEVLDSIKCEKVYVIESNHDVFLDRYINEGNWKNDLHNSPAYLEYALIQQTINLKEHGNIFGYLVNTRYKDDDRIQYVKYGDVVKINRINVSNHGDAGVNGSRGNVQTFKKLNVRTITAHTHSPSIQDGNICVGLSAVLDQYYTRRGASTHTQAHALIHKTGKRQLVVFCDDYKISHFI
ncbi:DNA transfer protein [Tenacibaculum phage PTm1]|uniref:A1-like protein n=2 Tax=Shirahamavirus PTm1 TaxID=2846435 RepID=A0A5S9BZ81_9CAUD|nr:DNA transfer protein [Tenacibaculum phage PTm1]BBI90680.1 hypothetical protein [Tenacibaculum phage PTm1]BBI90987.1 hypothetical protein [Tenacibaculum phage PTm5]